jgi:RND family efflux transporter MFP subunit
MPEFNQIGRYLLCKSFSRIRSAGCLGLGLGVILFAGCAKSSKDAASTQIESRHVRTARAEELNVPETVYATGALAPQDRAVLSAKVPGRVQSILVDLGTKVTKGDLLAQIEKRDFELHRQQAEAALAQARALLGFDLGGKDDALEPVNASGVKEARAVLSEASKSRERLMKLHSQGIVPEADIESAEAQFQVASNRLEEALQEAKNRLATLKQRQAELALAEQQLKDTEIRAPFDGVVERRQTSPGEFLNIATPVLTLVRIDPIRMRLEVAERDATKVRLGQKVMLRLEGSDEAREGTLSRLSPVISPGNRMLVAEADFPNPDGLLRPGAFAKADIVVDNRSKGLFVPKSSLVIFAGIQKVFVVHAGHAVEKEVSQGREKGDRIEVTGEIKPGDLVVLDPGSLRDGEPVESSAHES